MGREKKYFTFSQNNSGGYFITDENAGVCEYIIIEAESPEQALSVLDAIGDKVSEFWDYCSCCGERWYNYLDESDGKDYPSIYNTDVLKIEEGAYRSRCFIHYMDGRIVEVKFKPKESEASND